MGMLTCVLASMYCKVALCSRERGVSECFFFSSRRRHTRCSRDWSSDVCSSDLFHLSSFFLLRGLRPRIPDLFSQMKKSGLTTSLDTNDDPEDLWADDVKSALKSVDIFLPNEREACKLAGTADVQSALDVLAQLVPIVVIKCGPEGAMARRGKEIGRAHV